MSMSALLDDIMNDEHLSAPPTGLGDSLYSPVLDAGVTDDLYSAAPFTGVSDDLDSARPTMRVGRYPTRPTIGNERFSAGPYPLSRSATPSLSLRLASPSLSVRSVSPYSHVGSLQSHPPSSDFSQARPDFPHRRPLSSSYEHDRWTSSPSLSSRSSLNSISDHGSSNELRELRARCLALEKANVALTSENATIT